MDQGSTPMVAAVCNVAVHTPSGYVVIKANGSTATGVGSFNSGPSGSYAFATLTAGETDTIGPLSILFVDTGSGYCVGSVTLEVLPPGTDAVLAAVQPNYAPAKAGDPMTLTGAYDAAKLAAPPGAPMTLTMGAMQAFFSLNTGILYAAAVPGSVVHETASGAGGGSGDPLANAVPGMYAPGTAGFVIGTQLDASIKSVIYWIQQSRR